MSEPGSASADALVIVAEIATEEASRAALVAICAADARGPAGFKVPAVHDDASETHRRTPDCARFAGAVARPGLPAPGVRRLSRLHRDAA